MAKGARGEGYLETEDGEKLAVLFTNRALVEAEQATGKNVLQFVNQSVLGMGDVVQLLAIGLEHARRERKSRKSAYTVRDAYDLMDVAGFGEVLTVVVGAVANVLGYSAQKTPADPSEGDGDEEAEAGDEPAPPE
jgi:hypothetical protein